MSLLNTLSLPLKIHSLSKLSLDLCISLSHFLCGNTERALGSVFERVNVKSRSESKREALLRQWERVSARRERERERERVCVSVCVCVCVCVLRECVCGNIMQRLQPRESNALMAYAFHNANYTKPKAAAATHQSPVVPHCGH